MKTPIPTAHAMEAGSGRARANFAANLPHPVQEISSAHTQARA